MARTRRKKISISTRMNEHPNVFREDGGIMFCNYCDLSVEWKTKSTVDGHCLSKAHINKKEIYERNEQAKKQTTIFTINTASKSKKEETFVNAPARKGRYLTHLRMHGIENPCKIPLPNATRWNSWFRMVFYTKDHIEYWPSFYYEEYERDRSHNSISTINEILQNTEKKAFIIIYINFIACYAREFVQDLDFFQQQNKPVFPFVEGRLEQLTSYLEGNRAAEYFGSDLQSLITQYNYNPNDFYIIFRAAFDSAYNKFKVHIPQHPARSLFRASRVFDPLFLKIGIQTGDTSCSDICRYLAIMELSNPSDELLREWAIYCGSVKNLIIDQINLDLYWTEMQATLPILSNIALDCIWFPISSCSVERSFSTYNNLLSSDRQNLSRESLKQLNMLYFNVTAENHRPCFPPPAKAPNWACNEQEDVVYDTEFVQMEREDEPSFASTSSSKISAEQ
ncbi:hypothetical protein Glove_122g30 [Diversispora epigaea]|uniref:HAT C-terminal dimerisation domain-containing protein n=1 Tax=Diversispora epigaea TaxID=1348612 RepID=A0A397IZ03_9GLOM|nr:hypothetical protein Glove_122g30 [Diversispora epigaea]